MSDVKRNEHMLPITNWLREQINEVLARYDIPSDVYDYDILIDALCVCAVDKSQAAIRADLPPHDADVLAQEQDTNTIQIKPHPRDKKLKEFAALWLRGPIPANLMADLADILEDDECAPEKRVHQIVWQAMKWGMEEKEGRG